MKAAPRLARRMGLVLLLAMAGMLAVYTLIFRADTAYARQHHFHWSQGRASWADAVLNPLRGRVCHCRQPVEFGKLEIIGAMIDQWAIENPGKIFDPGTAVDGPRRSAGEFSDIMRGSPEVLQMRSDTTSPDFWSQYAAPKQEASSPPPRP